MKPIIFVMMCGQLDIEGRRISIALAFLHFLCFAVGLHKREFPILRPASVVHIGNRLKIGHCFMMSCMPNVLPRQF